MMQNVFFFLQEEMCFNVDTQCEQPLALQQLMMRHVKGSQQDSQKSSNRFDYISEQTLKDSFESQFMLEHK